MAYHSCLYFPNGMKKFSVSNVTIAFFSFADFLFLRALNPMNDVTDLLELSVNR